MTEFHLKSGDGFPPGEYAAEVFLDGQSVGYGKVQGRESSMILE